MPDYKKKNTQDPAKLLTQSQTGNVYRKAIEMTDELLKSALSERLAFRFEGRILTHGRSANHMWLHSM